jgi:predicted phage tail protein
VRAFSNAGNSGYSNEASTTTQSITPIPTAPTAPTGLNAVANLTTQITLNWTDNANNENGFKIERSTNSAGNFTEIAQVGAGITTFVNTGLNPSTTYFYRVRAFNDVGNSAYSNEANATTLSPPVPNAPINLIATSPTQGQVILNWTDNSTDETGFRIERSSGGAFTEIGQVGANVATFTDNNLTFGSMLTYRIRAFNAAGNSNFSNEANITVTAVGLIDISHSLQIYPNPSADKFILQLDYKKQGEFRFRMTDLAGRSIITHSWDKNGEVLFKEIEVNQLPSGVYILELVHEEFRAIKRFLKD